MKCRFEGVGSKNGGFATVTGEGTIIRFTDDLKYCLIIAQSKKLCRLSVENVTIVGDSSDDVFSK